MIRQVKEQAQGILNQTDWYVVRKADTDEAIPSSVATHRAAVRTKQASMETAITNAADTPALETLYKRNESGVRFIGDFKFRIGDILWFFQSQVEHKMTHMK